MSFIRNPFKLKIITAPTVEPVTAAQVKTYVHIDHDTEDAIINNWIKTAREKLEKHLRRSIARQTIEISYDKFPSMPILVPRPPLLSVRSIKYYDTDDTETAIDLTGFYFDYNSEPGRIEFNHLETWPTSTVLRAIDAVKIRCVAGYDTGYTTGTTTEAPDSDDIPAAIKESIYLYCTHRNENRSGEVDLPDAFFDNVSDIRMHS